MSKTCTRCGGTKKVLKLGLMQGTCDACKGTGNAPATPIITKKKKPKYPLLEGAKNGSEKTKSA